MKRFLKNIPLTIILIAYVVINVILFIILSSAMPEQLKSGTFWFVWAMSFIVSYGLNIFLVYLANGKSKSSFITETPLYMLMFAGSGVYVLSGLIMSFIPNLPFKVALPIELVISAIYAVVLILLYRGAKYINENNDNQAAKVANIRNLVADVDYICSSVSDPELVKKLKDLSELIRFSDPMSNDSVKDIEIKIEMAIFNMREYVSDNNTANLARLIDETSNLIKYRNQKVKISK